MFVFDRIEPGAYDHTMTTKNRRPRALIAVRLSRVTDATTSPERQVTACKELCAARGYDVVGIAEDLDVSAGKTTPFDRPQLGRCLKRPGEFDVIVFFRVDRVVRRLFDLADLIRWARTHSVLLVSATESHFDLSSEFGDVIALLIAKVAELELQAISERNASAFKHNFSKGKYRGGPPPWGYMPARDEDGDWRLVQDPVQVAVIHEVIDRVLTGEPLRAIAHDLTGRGVLTPRDRFAQLQGRPTREYAWHSGPLKRALTSQTLLGRAITRDVAVLDDAGRPIVRSEPIISRDVFDRLGVELAGRENRKEPTVRSSGLLLRVLYCGECGRAAYRLKGGTGRKPRYRCASAQYKDQCSNRSIQLEWAEQELERRILEHLGPVERRRRVWDPGSDVSDELSEVNAELGDLAESLGTPGFRRGTPQRERLDRRIEALSARQAELSQVTPKPAGWVYEGTGVTVREWWDDATTEERNVWLRQLGMRVVWRSHSEGKYTVVDEFRVDGDLTLDLDGEHALGPVWDVVQMMLSELPPDES